MINESVDIRANTIRKNDACSEPLQEIGLSFNFLDQKVLDQRGKQKQWYAYQIKKKRKPTVKLRNVHGNILS